MPSSLPSLTMSLLLSDVMTTPWPFYGTHGKFSQAKSFCEEVNRTRHLVLKKYNEASDNSKRLDRKYGFSGDKC